MQVTASRNWKATWSDCSLAVTITRSSFQYSQTKRSCGDKRDPPSVESGSLPPPASAVDFFWGVVPLFLGACLARFLLDQLPCKSSGIDSGSHWAVSHPNTAQRMLALRSGNTLFVTHETVGQQTAYYMHTTCIHTDLINRTCSIQHSVSFVLYTICSIQHTQYSSIHTAYYFKLEHGSLCLC